MPNQMPARSSHPVPRARLDRARCAGTPIAAMSSRAGCACATPRAGGVSKLTSIATIYNGDPAPASRSAGTAVPGLLGGAPPPATRMVQRPNRAFAPAGVRRAGRQADLPVFRAPTSMQAQEYPEVPRINRGAGTRRSTCLPRWPRTCAFYSPFVPGDIQFAEQPRHLPRPGLLTRMTAPASRNGCCSVSGSRPQNSRRPACRVRQGCGAAPSRVAPAWRCDPAGNRRRACQ